MQICLFGSGSVTSADGSRRFSLPRKTLDVLAYLVLNRRTLARENVAFALFPDAEEEVARGSLRRNLSYLLSSLPATPVGNRFVIADAESIGWNPRASAVIDVDVFERAIAENRDDDAIAAYTGELLLNLYADWTAADRERFCNTFHEALARKMQRERSLRNFDAAVAAGRRILNDDPWREDIVRQLIAIRYESGDRAGALAEFDRFAARMRTEMHADPMAETIGIREAVMRGGRLATSEAPSRRVDELAPSRGLPLVGRETALETARASWHAAADGHASLLFVVGEAGIGKSRFVAELAREIEREGGVAIIGETTAGGERHPYEAFIEALRAGALRSGLAAGGGDGPRRAQVETLLDDHASAILTDDRAARVRLFDAVRRNIADLARARPLAIVLEDLHWAGADTVDLLDFVSLRLSQAPVLLIATMRTDELARAHPLRALLRQLQSRGSAQTTSLRRLTALEAGAALSNAGIEDATAEFIARAVAWADGVPLFLAEALRDIAAGRDIPAGDVGALVGERFRRLTPAGETALVYAATIGVRFDVATLAAATGWSDDALIEALGESLELGLIRSAGNAPGFAFAFVHHLLQEAARERIPASERTRAHAMIARAIATLPAGRTSRAAEIARHFEAAGEPLRAAQTFLQAARYALSVFANDDAREAASAGLALAGNDRDLRYDLLITREDAFRRIGAVGERRADAHELVALAGGSVDRECEALERLFEAHRDDDGVCRDAVAKLERLAAVTERHAAVFDRVSARYEYALGNYVGARDASLRAAQRFERLGDERAALQARLQYVAVLGRLAAFEESEAEIARLRPLFEASEDVAFAAEFYRVACSAAADERRAESLLDARRSLDLSLRAGDRYAEARARQNIGFFTAKLRDYEESEREMKAALAAFRDVGDAVGINEALLNLAARRIASGDYHGASRMLDALHLDANRSQYLDVRVRIVRGVIELRTARYDEAESAFVEARSKAEKLGVELFVARCNGFLAEFCAMTRRIVEARALLEASLEQFARLKQPGLALEYRAISAHLYACNGESAAARADSLSARLGGASESVQDLSKFGWHLTATHALLGEHAAAREFAEAAARAFADDALAMSATLAETYGRLPWHRHAFAYLAGRDVPLRLADSLR